MKHKLLGLALAAGLSAVPLSAQASGRALTCWDISGQKHNLNPLLLMAIGSVESSLREGIASRNTNGSYDLGIMQINTIHLPYFKKMGYSRHDLQHNSCKNIIAAGYLLKSSIKRYGYNVNGIGGYHSNTPHLRIKYGRKVLKEYNRLASLYGKSRARQNYVTINPTQSQAQAKLQQVNGRRTNQTILTAQIRGSQNPIAIRRQAVPTNQQYVVLRQNEPVSKQALMQPVGLQVKRFRRSG